MYQVQASGSSSVRSAWTSWAKWLVSMLYSSMTLKLHDEDFILNLR